MDIPSVIAENLKSDNEKLLSLTKRYPYYAELYFAASQNFIQSYE